MAAPLRQAMVLLSRLNLSGAAQSCNISTCSGPNLFRATPCLGAMPMKKKKRVDPTALLEREKKKKNRLLKAIRRLESKARKLKPITEIEGERKFMKTLAERKREPPVLSFEESEYRALLHKEWTRYKVWQHKAEMADIWKAMNAQEDALQALREESEELYQQAIQVDPESIPFERTGPPLTPPVPGYQPPDGDYIDTTKKYDRTVGRVDIKNLRI